MKKAVLTARAAGRRISFKERLGTDKHGLQPTRESEPQGYDITRQVGHLLRKAYQSHMAIFQSLSSNPQITPTQFAVLCALKDRGPCSLTDIGRHIVMDLATARGIVARLAQRGLVSFSRDSADRRQVIARLEPAGREVLDGMIPSAQQISEATVKHLTVAERVALQYLLEKISITTTETTSIEEASTDPM